MVDKVIRDGMVAVLISPGFGSGWSTWNLHHPQMLFDPVIVEILLNAKKGKEAFVAGQIVAHVEANYSDYYAGGVDNLEVEWVPVGTEFIVDEYDGDETIRTKDGFAWIKA